MDSTLAAERKCDCSYEESWEEVGSTWLCTCPDTHAREKTETAASKEIRTGGAFPAYSENDLMAKVREMYPEIVRHDISFSLNFNARKNAYILDFRKDGHELTTHLEKKDADECMADIKCVYLGVQVGQFIRNFEEEVSY